MRLAIRGGERRAALRWGSYIASHPRRLQGLFAILAFHAVSRRRVAALHAAAAPAPR